MKPTPSLNAHDLGAGGDCNALPEIVEPAGAVIDLRAIPVGDQTLSVLEIWGNESQERNALLIAPSSLHIFETLAARENVPLAVVGRVTGDGVLVLFDAADRSRPVELPLDDILGQLPPKRFDFEHAPREFAPLVLPPESDFRRTLELVLRLPSIGSKRFLTSKVDLDVTGLVVQRQLVGPRHLPLSDYALIAQSYSAPSGTALSLGEQPLKGLISPGAGARMAVAEALLNLAGVKVTDIAEIKCSGNWMLAVKQPGEGAWLYDAACALREILVALGMAIDGGKDSLSMASHGYAPDGSTGAGQGPAAAGDGPLRVRGGRGGAGHVRSEAEWRQAPSALCRGQAAPRRKRARSGAFPTRGRSPRHRRSGAAPVALRGGPGDGRRAGDRLVPRRE